MTPSASNPILDHIDDVAKQAQSQLAQPAKLAVAQAAPALSRIFEPPGGVGSLPADPNQLAGGPQPMPSQPAVPTAIGGTAPGGPEPNTPRPLATAASMGRVPRTWGPLENSQAETARLTTGDTSKPGWEQIHNPWLRTAAGIGNAALGGFFPKVAAQVPGTTLHHNMLVRNAEGAEKQQESQLDEGQKRGLEQAQTENQEAVPELHRTQQELGFEKQHATEAHQHAQEDIAREKEHGLETAKQNTLEGLLRTHGYGADGEPLEYKDLSQEQQALHDLRTSQKELSDANSALKKAQKDNSPIAAQMAQARIATARQNAATATGRLGLSKDQFEAEYLGTHGGASLPGAPADEAGNPIGTKVAGINKPTGTQRTRADLAQSAHERIQEMKSIIAKRPDIFGPLAGRKTDFNTWVGSQDPDASTFRAAQTAAAHHLIGTFGGRSEQGADKMAAALGRFKDNPAAAMAGLDELDRSTQGFIKAGATHTVIPGKGPATGGGKHGVYNQATGKTEWK